MYKIEGEQKINTLATVMLDDTKFSSDNFLIWHVVLMGSD